MTTPATRDKILQAALEVFAEKGYHRALVDDIVRASRTSKGAVYHHFPNKEALFLALVDEFSAGSREAVAAAHRGRARRARQGGGRAHRGARDLRPPPGPRPHPAPGVGEPGARLSEQATRSARALRRAHPGLSRRRGGGGLDPAARHAGGHLRVAGGGQRGGDPVALQRAAGPDDGGGARADPAPAAEHRGGVSSRRARGRSGSRSLPP